jgi:hypothetical protein
MTDEWIDMLEAMGVNTHDTPAEPQAKVPTDMSGAYLSRDGHIVTVVRWPPSWVGALKRHLMHLDTHPCPVALTALIRLCMMQQDMMQPMEMPLARYLLKNPALAEMHEIDFSELSPSEIEDIVELRNDDFIWVTDYDGDDDCY